MNWKECEQLLFDKCNRLALSYPQYRFEVGKIGGWIETNYQPMWGSIFVTDPDDIQIGRLIFRDGSYDHYKAYGHKPNFIWRVLESLL